MDNGSSPPPAADTVDLTSLIDDGPMRPFQWRVVTLCALAAALEGFDLQLAGSLAPAISASLKIPPSAFGTILAAGFLGVAVGSVVFGRAADKFGRKWTIVASTLIFAVFTLLTPFLAQTQGELSALRFLAGIGIGGVIPNVLALTAEYAPARRRAFILNLMYVGFPLGGVILGFIASLYIDSWGWRTFFVVGAILPLVVSVLLIAGLPESATFLVLKNAGSARIEHIARRLTGQPSSRDTETHTFTVQEQRSARGSMSELFSNGLRSITILVWAILFLSLGSIIFVVSWLPTIMKANGLSLSNAVLLPSMFSLGGIFGSLLIGRCIDRIGTYLTLSTSFLLAGVAMALYGPLGHSLSGLLVVAAVSGVFLVGAQAGMNALVASMYPADLRATGLGAALGVGRLGSVIAPAIGGWMVGAHWQATTVFYTVAASQVAAAILVVLAQSSERRRRATQPNAELVTATAPYKRRQYSGQS